jgi:hypothetical protein
MRGLGGLLSGGAQTCAPDPYRRVMISIEEVSGTIGEADPAAAVVAVDLAGARLHRVGRVG